MLSPGSKNWVEKYFQLVAEGEIIIRYDDIDHVEDKVHFLHAEFFQSGIIFGYPCELIYAKNLDQSSWTLDESLKVLLLETYIKTYVVLKGNFEASSFLKSLNEFLQEFNTSWFKIPTFKRINNYTKIEALIEKRIHGRRKWTNMFWSSYLNNSLVFVDVVVFLEFLENGSQNEADIKTYSENCIISIALAAYADGKLDSSERNVLNVFYNSQGIDNNFVSDLKKSAEELSFDSLYLPKQTSKIFRLYLLDLAVMTVFSDLIAEEEERYFLQMFSKHIGLSQKDLHKSIVLIESFVISNNHKITFLQEMTTYDRLYSSFSKRWIKVLGRNKDKLVEELKNNKELIELVNRSMVRELNPEEKEKVKSQFRELIKSMPALAIFMLPGGALLLPIITRIIPDLIPNSFRKNKLDRKGDNKHPDFPVQ